MFESFGTIQIWSAKNVHRSSNASDMELPSLICCVGTSVNKLIDFDQCSGLSMYMEPSASSKQQIRRKSKRLGTSCSTCGHGHVVLPVLANISESPNSSGVAWLSSWHLSCNVQGKPGFGQDRKNRFPLEPNMI